MNITLGNNKPNKSLHPTESSCAARFSGSLNHQQQSKVYPHSPPESFTFGKNNMFRPPEHLIVHETDHWTINHRIDAALPGYLMLGSKVETNDLSELSIEALSELGVLLSRIQQALTEILEPEHFYVGRYGHMTGHAIHFHVIPVCDWVARAFDSDERYRTLRQFYTSGVYEDGSDSTFDGAEMTLFIWREFCESVSPPDIVGLTVEETIKLAQKKLAEQVAASDR